MNQTAPSLSRSKCLISAALVVEIVLFSIVTFVIAYVNSLNAIHHASQQLADSMVDTVAVRVTGYINTTEQSVRNLAVTRRDAMLPEDYGPSSAGWSTEWTLALRSVLMAMDYDVYAVAMLLDDASLVGESTVNRSLLVRDTLIDARMLLTDGYRLVNVSTWDSVTKAVLPYIAYATEWPSNRDYSKAHTVGYYTLKALYGTDTAWCAWTLVYLDSMVGKFDTCFTCNVLNATGVLIGQLDIVRDIDAFGRFLKQAAVTPNTTIFMVDESLYLTAASTAAPTAVIYPANANVTINPGCMTSAGFAPGAPVLVGCRASVHDYPYEPLQSLAASDLDLLQSPTRHSAYRQLVGSTGYYIVSLPVVNSGFKRSLHLVLFLPEGDVLTGVQQGLVLALGISVVLCLVGALLSSFLVATLIDGSTKRRSRSDVEALPSLDRTYAAYTTLLGALRAFERSRPAVGTTASAATQGAVVLVLQVQHISEVPKDPCSWFQDEAVQCVEAHGGCLVHHQGHASSRRTAAVLWREHDVADEGDCGRGVDHLELRAVLCGLSLLRLGRAAAAVVVRGDVLRYHSDPFRHGTLLQHAEALLLAEKRTALLLASEAVLQRCPSGLLVTHEDGDGFSAVTGVTASSIGPEPPRVRFRNGPAPLCDLLTPHSGVTPAES